MRKTQKRKRKRRKTLRTKRVGGAYDDRMRIYAENMQHIDLLQDPSICEVKSMNLGSTGKESLGVYAIIHDTLKNMIYKKMHEKGINDEIRLSYILSNLVTRNIFPHFPIYYGFQNCKGYSIRFYEKASGDGEQWTRKNYADENIRNKFISFLMQSAMIGYCLQHEKIWISDFKPANWLYLDATESSNQYFHYRYRNKNDTYMDIYVRCTGELWLRSDFGNAINFKNFKNRVSFSKSSIKDTWKMYDDIMIREPGPSKVPYYIEKMEQQAAMKEPLPFDQMRITFDFIQRIKKQEDDNRQDWLAYTAIHRIRSEEPIKQIYNHLVEAFSDITKLNNQGVFGESLLIERPSEELIINKTPYQLNY